MKRPYYYLLDDVHHSTEDSQQLVVKGGQIVTPIMNSDYLPNHLRKTLDENNRFNQNDPYVMCPVGPHWVLIKKSNIKEVI